MQLSLTDLRSCTRYHLGEFEYDRQVYCRRCCDRRLFAAVARDLVLGMPLHT